MKQIEGGVIAAKGYTTAGTRAGIKKGIDFPGLGFYGC